VDRALGAAGDLPAGSAEVRGRLCYLQFMTAGRLRPADSLCVPVQRSAAGRRWIVLMGAQSAPCAPPPAAQARGSPGAAPDPTRAQALADGGLAARVAAPLVSRLRPLLAREYVCEAALLPWLLALQGAGLGAPGAGPGAPGAEHGACKAPGPAVAATPELRLAVQLLSVPAPWPRVRTGPAGSATRWRWACTATKQPCPRFLLTPAQCCMPPPPQVSTGMLASPSKPALISGVWGKQMHK